MQDYKEYSVRDSVQTYKFNGQLLAESSSRVGNRPRWVEFRLFRTPKGTFIISRVGVSLLYHASHCSVVSRNKLSQVAEEKVPPTYVPCPDCRPVRVSPTGVFPETPRYWALHTDEARHVIANLKKHDKEGVEYLTHVVTRLLISASKIDEDLHEAFYAPVRIE